MTVVLPWGEGRIGFSLRGAVDKIGDGGEKLLGKAKKKAGEVIDHGAHIVGDGLEHVGLDDAADWVEDKGDAVADDLGAHVAEQQLGQSDEPEELLHGGPGRDPGRGRSLGEVRPGLRYRAHRCVASGSGRLGRFPSGRVPSEVHDPAREMGGSVATIP